MNTGQPTGNSCWVEYIPQDSNLDRSMVNKFAVRCVRCLPCGMPTCTAMVTILPKPTPFKLPPSLPASCTTRCTHSPLYVGNGSSCSGVKLREAAMEISPLPLALNTKLDPAGILSHLVLLRATSPALLKLKRADSRGTGFSWNCFALLPLLLLVPGRAATAVRVTLGVALDVDSSYVASA